MTHRERIVAALKHQAPDRVPIDLGGTGSSTISVRTLERLRAYLDLPADPPPVSIPSEVRRRFPMRPSSSASASTPGPPGPESRMAPRGGSLMPIASWMSGA